MILFIVIHTGGLILIEASTYSVANRKAYELLEINAETIITILEATPKELEFFTNPNSGYHIFSAK